MSYEQKLMAMKKQLKKTTSQVKVEKAYEKPIAPAYEENWLKAGLVKEENHLGIFYKRIVHYQVGSLHGNTVLSNLNETIDLWKEVNENHPLSPDFSKPIVFFDTETTGLKGAGALIFLMGFIEQIDSSYRLTQYLLPGPDHEPAFLYASRFWEKNYTVITYNGKSFDLPQLETRWTMNRNHLPSLLKHDQIDLLHGSRRIWKEELTKFNLKTIEEKQLDFHRTDDIPGHLAPIIYQDAVKNGRADALMRILLHNEWDIVSLVALYIRSTQMVLQQEKPSTVISHTNIGKWFADLKSYTRGQEVFEQLLHEYESNHPEAHFHFAFLMKRKHLHEEAITSFKIASENCTGRNQIIAFEELAKLFEHKLKEFELALAFTKQAQQLIEKDDTLTKRFRDRARNNFQKREIRLQRKIFPGQAQ